MHCKVYEVSEVLIVATSTTKPYLLVLLDASLTTKDFPEYLEYLEILLCKTKIRANPQTLDQSAAVIADSLP